MNCGYINKKSGEALAFDCALRATRYKTKLHAEYKVAQGLSIIIK